MDRVLTADDFARYVGKTFTLRGRDCALRLVAIDRPIFAGIETLPRAPFILLFCGPPDDVLREGMYDFALSNESATSMFISPIRTFGSDRQDYQAVFN